MVLLINSNYIKVNSKRQAEILLASISFSKAALYQIYSNKCVSLVETYISKEA